MDLQHKKMNDLFQFKCNHEAYAVEIYFYTQGSGSNMLFTSGYMNPEASGELFLKICSVGALIDNVGFIGVISGDNRIKVKDIIMMAKKAVQRRVKSFKNGAKSVEDIDAMTTDEVGEKFFPDHTGNQPKKDPVKEENKSRFSFRLRKPKTDLVDLTCVEEEEKSEEGGNVSVCSSLFYKTCCSDMEGSLEGSSSEMTDDKEKVPNKVIHPPFDEEHFLDHFLYREDKDFIVDPEDNLMQTMSLEAMQADFAERLASIYQNQEDDEKRQNKQWREENSTKTSFFRTFHDDSSVTRRQNSRKTESSTGKSQQSTVKDHFKMSFGNVSSTSSRNENNPSSSSLSSPKLGRGIDPKKDVINLSEKKSRLLDTEDYDKLEKQKRESTTPKFYQPSLSFSSSQPIPPNFTIPKKTSRSPVHGPSPSILEKSPNTSVKARPSINSRTSAYSSGGERGAMMVTMALKRLPTKLVDKVESPCRRYDPRDMAEPLGVRRTPQSIEGFIDGIKDQEIINLDGGSDSDEENKKKNGKHKRKLLEIEPPSTTTNRIFKSKQPRRNQSGPNFGRFDGSSHKEK
jgi:hypothetical protein